MVIAELMCRRVPSSKSGSDDSDQDRGDAGSSYADLFAEAAGTGSDDDDDDGGGGGGGGGDDDHEEEEQQDDDEEERLWRLQVKQQREAKREERWRRKAAIEAKAREETEKGTPAVVAAVPAPVRVRPGPFLSRSPGSRFKFDESEIVPCAGVPPGELRARAACACERARVPVGVRASVCFP